MDKKDFNFKSYGPMPVPNGKFIESETPFKNWAFAIPNGPATFADGTPLWYVSQHQKVAFREWLWKQNIEPESISGKGIETKNLWDRYLFETPLTKSPVMPEPKKIDLQTAASIIADLNDRLRNSGWIIAIHGPMLRGEGIRIDAIAYNIRDMITDFALVPAFNAGGFTSMSKAKGLYGTNWIFAKADIIIDLHVRYHEL